MKEPKLIDFTLLSILALIWASAFFNIKIATESFGPITIAFFNCVKRENYGMHSALDWIVRHDFYS